MLSDACHFDLRQIILISALINGDVHIISACKEIKMDEQNSQEREERLQRRRELERQCRAQETANVRYDWQGRENSIEHID